MDGMLGLFDTVAHADCHNVLLQTFLKTCSDHRVFVNKAPVVVQSVVENIGGKLNSSATRYDGLLLLKTFLPQCPAEIFGENVMFWMQQCLKSVGGQNKHVLTNVSYLVLKILLQMSQQMPEMRRVISGNVVTKIIDNFQQVSPQEASLSMLECLEVLMCNYGPSCGQQKNVLEKCVLQYVDSSDINVIKIIAHCVAFFPLLGGGSSLGANHVSRWKQEQQKVCATLHSILDELFDNVREIPSSRSPATIGQALSLPPMSESMPLLRVHQLMARFINVSKFLQALLISEFPVEKTVLPDEILGVICRGLAVNSHTMGKKVSADLLMVGAMLPQIHIALLKVLDSLIICCGCNLLPYGPVVCKLVLQTLKWTSAEKWAYGIEKPYGQLRIAACNTLMLWLQTSNCGSCVELISEQLVPIVMQDIWFQKEAVTLNVHKTSSKKQQKCNQNASEQQGVWNLRKYIPEQKANSKTCRAALRVLQCLLHSAAAFIKPTLHRLLQETAVGLIFEIQRTSRAHDFPVPYSETSCRLELYRLLHTLVLEPHATWPPPTQFAFHMLSAGRSDPSLEVSHFCTAALIAVEKLVHPASGTLHFPVTLEEMLESTRTYGQEYSTKPKESSSFVETYKEGDVQNDVRSRTGSSGLEQVTCNSDDTGSSSEEVVIEYDSRIEVDDDETNEYEKEEISECEITSVGSEKSDSSVENEVWQPCRLLEMLSKHDVKQEVSVIDTSESDEELECKEAQSASVMGIRGKNGGYTNVGVCEKDVSKHLASRTDDKMRSVSCVPHNQDSSVVISVDLTENVCTTANADNEHELLSHKQQTKNAESSGDARNGYGKGSEGITASAKISAANKSLLVTESEEKRQDNDSVNIVEEDKDDCEPDTKRMKLGEKSDVGSHCKVKDCTTVPITRNHKREQQADGTGQDPEVVTEEEMLQAFVDALTD